MLKLVIVNLVSNAVKFTSMRTQAQIEIGCVDGHEGRSGGVLQGQWRRL